MKSTLRLTNGEWQWDPPLQETQEEKDRRWRELVESRGRYLTLHTNTTFLSAFAPSGGQFEGCPDIGDHYQDVARDAGVDITGKVYLTGLAEFPGDPRAWVSDRDEALRVAEERGWGAEGAGCKVAPRLDGPPPQTDIADDIVDERVVNALVDHPEPERVDVGELRHEIRESLLPKV